MIVLGDNGQLLDDVTMTELFLADLEATVDDLIGPPWPVTVLPNAGLDEITERLVETRHSSVVVVDEEERPSAGSWSMMCWTCWCRTGTGSGSPGGCHKRRAGGGAATAERGSARDRPARPAPVRRPLAAPDPDAARVHGARDHRGQRGQRRGRDRYLRKRRGPVRVPDAVRDGPGDRGPGRGAGDVRPARRLHRGGPRRADPGAVQHPGHGVRAAGADRRQRRAGRLRIRRDRGRDGATWRLEVHQRSRWRRSRSGRWWSSGRTSTRSGCSWC